jgi:aerobic carbon-monoxide dehydrogenase large subunit
MSAAPTTGYVGSPVARREDRRLLIGDGRYAADIKLPGMSDAAFVRSPVAHGIIRTLDVSRAREMEGVRAVYTAADLAGRVAGFTRPFYKTIDADVERQSNLVVAPYQAELLAVDKVYRVGEPMAVIVADDRYIAEDAAELVEIDIEPLPVVADSRSALAPGAPVIHPHIPGNIHASFTVRAGDPDAAMAAAPHRLEGRFRSGRSVGSPMETRGVVVDPDANRGMLTVWAANQRPHLLRTYMAEMLDMPEDAIRVVAPDMGGSFGGGIYSEEIVMAFIGMDLNRPVRWIEDRRENLGNARQSRDQDHDVEVGFDDEGRILVLRDRFTIDCGAYNPFAITLSYNTAAHLRSQFRIEHFECEGLCVVTNKLQTTPIRGAGRPEAVFVIDRIVDLVATRTGRDPADVRRLNLIPGDEMPYDMGMLYRDGGRVVYDSGNYVEQFDRVAEMIDHAGFRVRQAELKASGRHVGIGYSSHVEGSGYGPHEGAVIRVDGRGHVMVHTGSNSHGQSHETTLAQVCADALGVDVDDITVKTGDTAIIQHGGGTFASRSAVTAGSAVHMAGRKLRDKIIAIAAHHLEANPDDLDITGGFVRSRDVPDLGLSLAEVADLAAPGRRLPEGIDPGLEVDSYYVPPTVTYSSGTHAVIVEVDADTGHVKILDYKIVDECGTVINPTVVDGQQHGGVAHGVGNALLEEFLYDEDCQPLNGTFVDYLLPSACEVPVVAVEHQEDYPSPLNPIGVKGAGEGATASAPAAIANAIADALMPLEIELDTLPVTPARLRHLIVAARQRAAG